MQWLDAVDRSFLKRLSLVRRALYSARLAAQNMKTRNLHDWDASCRTSFRAKANITPLDIPPAAVVGSITMGGPPRSLSNLDPRTRRLPAQDALCVRRASRRMLQFASFRASTTSGWMRKHPLLSNPCVTHDIDDASLTQSSFNGTEDMAKSLCVGFFLFSGCHVIYDVHACLSTTLEH